MYTYNSLNLFISLFITITHYGSENPDPRSATTGPMGATEVEPSVPSVIGWLFSSGYNDFNVLISQIWQPWSS